MPAVVAHSSRRRRSMSEINMVPFIDVMLVLLIIFMVSAPLITTGIVDLPSVGKARQRAQHVIEVVVGDRRAAEGAHRPGRRQRSRAQSTGGTHQGRCRPATPTRPVVIAADRNVKYEQVVKVMDVLQRAGVHASGWPSSRRVDRAGPHAHVRSLPPRGRSVGLGAARRRLTMAMDSTLTRQDNLMPQRAGGMGRGTALALLVHVGLLIALAFGVSWRSQTPAGVSAELWAAVPQIAAPPAVEPKPTPAPTPPAPTPPKVEAAPPPKPSESEAEIAIEKEKAERKLREQREQQERERKEQQERERKEQERKEQERIEREKAEKLAAQKQRELEIKRQKEEEARQAKQREENLKRMLGQAGGTGAPNATGTAARDAGPSSSYAGRIVARVKPNIVFDRRGARQPERRRRSALRARRHHRRTSARQEQRQQGVGRRRAARARPHRSAAARHRRPRAVDHGDCLSAARMSLAVRALQGAASLPRSALIGAPFQEPAPARRNARRSADRSSLSTTRPSGPAR